MGTPARDEVRMSRRSKADLPYWLTIAITGPLLAWFVVTQEPFEQSTAAETTEPSTTAAVLATPLAVAETTTTTAPPTTLPALQGLAFEVITDTLTEPVLPIVAPGGDGTIFVLERGGTIQRVDPDTGIATPVLAIATNAAANIELGLLGMAFHPGFADNRRLFVYFTGPDNGVEVVEYRMDASGSPDPATAKSILSIARPPEGLRHNGGMMQFGPDGLLYIASGDNTRFATEPQDPHTLLGAILRIDVDGGDPYATPPDNPWADGSGAPEVWAIGLRNPWRFHIDAEERVLYLGDVGQLLWEEIDVVPLEPVGYNFGWPHLEGEACWSPETDCPTTGMTPPVITYSHDQGCSVTAGPVYRGTAIPELKGHAVFSDWCAGWLRSFRFEDGTLVGEIVDRADLSEAGQVASFGLDQEGELLFVTSQGVLARIVPIR